MKNNKQDAAEFAAILQGLIINSSVKYRTPEEEKAAFKFYFGALKHLGIDEIADAVKAILRTWKWNRLPTVAEILDHVPGQKLIQIEDKARIQAQLVIKTLRTSGAHTGIGWKDPITKWIMANRWPYYNWASQALEKELHWWEKEFITLYKSMDQAEDESRKHLDFTPRSSDPEAIGDVLVRALPKMGGKNVIDG